MTLFNLGAVRGLITHWAENTPNWQFLSGVAQVCHTGEMPELSSFEGEIRSALSQDDVPQQRLATQKMLTLSDTALEAVAPVAVALALEERGTNALDAFLAQEHAPFFTKPLSDTLRASFRQPHPVKGKDAPRKVALLDAVRRQSAAWDTLHNLDQIPLEVGALSTSGNFDSVMMRLLQQGYEAIARLEQDAVPPHLFAYLPTAETLSDIYSLFYTAGVQKRGYPIHQLEWPFRTVGFPFTAEADLRSRVQLQCTTSAGKHLESVFSLERLRQICNDAFICYSPKAYTSSGYDVDQWLAHVIAETGRKDVGTNYISGFTGASAVFAGSKQLPYIKDRRIKALHLGFGTSHLERGLCLALLMTGVKVAPDDNVHEIFKELGIVIPVGGASVYTVENLHLELPIIISVYTAEHLRKAQLLFAIHKNSYSAIAGQRAEQKTIVRLESGDLEEPAAIDEDAENYKVLIGELLKGLESVLTRVGGMSEEEAVVLPLSIIDAITSWKMEKDEIGSLHALNAKFFQGKMTPEQFRAAVMKIYKTRNPAMGTALEAGKAATAFEMTDDRYDLMPPDETFEALVTAKVILELWPEEKRDRLPKEYREFLDTVEGVGQPTVLPVESRTLIHDVKDYLLNRVRGDVLTSEQRQAVYHDYQTEQAPGSSHSVTIEEFVQAVQAVADHLDRAKGIIQKRHMKNPQLIEKGMVHLVTNVRRLKIVARTASMTERHKKLQNADVKNLMYKLAGLLAEIDRLHLGVPFNEVFDDMKAIGEEIYAMIRPRPKSESQS